MAEDSSDEHVSRHTKVDIIFTTVSDILGINLLLKTFASVIVLYLYNGEEICP